MRQRSQRGTAPAGAAAQQLLESQLRMERAQADEYAAAAEHRFKLWQQTPDGAAYARWAPVAQQYLYRLVRCQQLWYGTWAADAESRFGKPPGRTKSWDVYRRFGLRLAAVPGVLAAVLGTASYFHPHAGRVAAAVVFGLLTAALVWCWSEAPALAVRRSVRATQRRSAAYGFDPLRRAEVPDWLTGPVSGPELIAHVSAVLEHAAGVLPPRGSLLDLTRTPDAVPACTDFPEPVNALLRDVLRWHNHPAPVTVKGLPW